MTGAHITPPACLRYFAYTDIGTAPLFRSSSLMRGFAAARAVALVPLSTSSVEDDALTFAFAPVGPNLDPPGDATVAGRPSVEPGLGRTAIGEAEARAAIDAWLRAAGPIDRYIDGALPAPR